MTLYKFETADDANASFSEFSDNVIGKQEFIVLVTAKWCGHCIALKDEWEKMKVELKRKNKNSIKIVHVDEMFMTHMTDKHPDHAFSNLLKSAVQGFPTLVKVNKKKAVKKSSKKGGNLNGGVVEFLYHNGQRNANDLFNFVVG